ncbi:MAG: Ig-like domain-containing protein [Fibrobacterales bacterium]
MNRLVYIALLLLCPLSFSAPNDNVYKNNLTVVLGDTKQAFITNKINDSLQVEHLVSGFEKLRVSGIRIPIFGEGLTPNKEMFDYFYTLAVSRGFTIFANPAEFDGGKRIANGLLDAKGESVLDNPAKTTVLIERIISFAQEYPSTWIAPLNEDGAPGMTWSINQFNTIFESLDGSLNGAQLIGPCQWGLPAGIATLQNTSVIDHITVATSHNLGFNHGKWPEFIALAKAKGLPVWDSEVNFYDKNGTGTRLEAAIDAGVDGLVLYNSWNLINKTDGSLNNAATSWLNLYFDHNTSKAPVFITPHDTITSGDTLSLVSLFDTVSTSTLPITWHSSDTKIVAIDSEGTARGDSSGTAQITVYFSESGDSTTISLTVLKAEPLSIAVQKDIHLCPTGENSSKTIIATPQDGNPPYTISWNDETEGESMTVTSSDTSEFRVTVIDARGNSTQETIDVHRNTMPDITITTDNPTCTSPGTVHFKTLTDTPFINLAYSIDNGVSYKATISPPQKEVSYVLSTGNYTLRGQWTSPYNLICSSILDTISILEPENCSPGDTPESSESSEETVGLEHLNNTVTIHPIDNNHLSIVVQHQAIVTIYDILGNIVLKTPLSAGTHTLIAPIKGLNLVQVSSKKHRFTKKILLPNL